MDGMANIFAMEVTATLQSVATAAVRPGECESKSGVLTSEGSN